MADDKGKVTDKASEIAKNIWLAGIGAYGRAVEEAQGRLEKAMEPPKLFRDLVKAGAALEDDARRGTVAARHSVEERINRVRENFHNQRPARIEDLLALERKIEQLSRKVDQLGKALSRHGLDATPDAKASGRTLKGSPRQRSEKSRASAGEVTVRDPARKKPAKGKSTVDRRKTGARKRST